MQFLVEGADKSLSIIYKKSIIVEKIDAPLAIGDHIKFLWPENAKIQKEFSGTIIAKSDDENALLSLKDKKVRAWKTGVKNYGKATTLTNSGVAYGQGKKRKQPATLMDKEILQEVGNKEGNTLEGLTADKPKVPEWVFDAFENLKHEVCQELDSVKAKFLTKMDFLQSSFPCDSDMPTEKVTNETEVAAESRRRSYGMPLEFDDVPDNQEENVIELDSTQHNVQTTKSQVHEASDEKLDQCEKSVEIIQLNSDYSDSDLLEKIDDKQIKKEVAEKPESHIDNWSAAEVSVLTRVKSEKESSDEDSWLMEKSLQSKIRWLISSDEEIEKEPSKLQMVNQDKSKKDIFLRYQSLLRVKHVSEINYSKPSTSSYLPKKSSSTRKRSLILSSSEDEENYPPMQSGKTRETESKKSCSRVKNVEEVNNYKDNNKFDDGRANKSKNSNAGNDRPSEWTLKHREPSETVKELVKGTGIYAKQIDVETATNKCYTHNDLARALMKAVFTHEALMTCSLTGQKPRVPGRNRDVKPGLDESAVDAILLFVKKHAEKRGWREQDIKLIRRSMSNKLLEMHAD